jgi:hypothetical protein
MTTGRNTLCEDWTGKGKPCSRPAKFSYLPFQGALRRRLCSRHASGVRCPDTLKPIEQAA